MVELELSGRRPNKWLSLLIWLFPHSGFKLWALRRLGNKIGRDVTIGPNLVLGCGPFTLGDGVRIQGFNIFRRLSSAEIGRNALIGQFNQFTAAPVYQALSPYVGKLLMAESTVIINRHYLDCSGQFIMHRNSAIGGIKTIVQTHEADLTDDTTKVGQIVLGDNSMTGTACILLKDSFLPPQSILAAGSLLTKGKKGVPTPESALYGGVPARYVKDIEDLVWWRRQSSYTQVQPFDDGIFRSPWESTKAFADPADPMWRRPNVDGPNTDGSHADVPNVVVDGTAHDDVTR